MGQLKCVICGEPTAHEQHESCSYCMHNIHFQIRNMAAGGISYFYEEETYYHAGNWHTHPSVVARREFVANGKVDITTKWSGAKVPSDDFLDAMVAQVALRVPMGPYGTTVPPETVKQKAAQCGFTESMMEHVESLIGVPEEKPTAKYFQQVGRSHRGPPILSGCINDLIKKGHVVLFKDEIEKLPSLVQPRAKHETTHTFSAELSSGEVVTMPSPGDDWTKVETVEHKRGNMRTSFVNLNGHSLVSKEHKDELGYVPKTLEFKTDLQKCWVHEYRRMFVKGAPILSITTWARTVPPPAVLPEPYDYYCPSRENTIGLEIWPENGHVR